MARRKLLQQAADETLLRYGPEERGLARLLRESRANFKLGIRAEEATAAGVKAVAKHARPLIRKTYAAAGSTFDQADKDLQTLGGASSDAAVREAAGARRRLAEAAADADSELVQRGVDAETGRAYGVRQRRQEYQGERGKILEERRALGREEGLFAQTSFRQLSEADAKLALDRRRVRITAGNLRARRQHDRATERQSQQRLDETGRHNRQTEKNARDNAGGKGKPKFTPLQRRDAHAMWDLAKTRAETYLKAGALTDKTAEQIALRLEDKFGVKLPLARAAVQVVLHGGVRRGVRRRIRSDYGLKPRLRHRSKLQDPLERLLGGG